MSTWNYRILAFEQEEPIVNGADVLQICEVYYDNKGNPEAYTDRNGTISSEGLKGLKKMLKMYKEALKQPILYAGDKFPQEYELKN